MIATTGAESVEKRKPGSGFGRSRKSGGLIVRAALQPSLRLQWTRSIEPLLAEALAYSSQASQKSPRPPAPMVAPWEKFEPGTSSTVLGAVGAVPGGRSATRRCDGPSSPSHESKRVQAT